MVSLVKSKKTDRLLVSKAIEFDDENQLAAEIKALQVGNGHPHIVQLIDHFRESSDIYCLIFEYCELGDLSDYIKKTHEQKLDVSLATSFLKQIADTLNFIHFHDIIHRDIKPLNILLRQGSDGQIVAKLADFGISKLATRAKTNIGTEKYKAPEILRDEEVYTKKVDMWSLGCTYFEMITGESLFLSHKAKIILTELDELSSRIPQNLDEFSGTILTGLLQLNPAKRLSAQEVIQRATNPEHLFYVQRVNELFERVRYFSDLQSWEELKALAEDKIDSMNNFPAKAFVMVIYSRGSILDLIPVEGAKANEISAALRLRLEQEVLDKAMLADPYISYILGVIYQDGLGVPQDDKIAFAHYKNSAQQEYANAQSSLGYMYENGLGVDADDLNYETAFKWYFKAAQQDNAHAQNNLGIAYERGIGVNANYEKAFEWYLKAAKQGHPIAQSNLGSLYEKGLGATLDREKALEWYSKAAKQREPIAQASLDRLSEMRLGVTEDA